MKIRDIRKTREQQKKHDNARETRKNSGPPRGDLEVTEKLGRQSTGHKGPGED